MAADVDEVDDEVVVVDPAVVEAVAAELLGGDEAGGDGDQAVEVARENRGDVAGGAAEFGYQPASSDSMPDRTRRNASSRNVTVRAASSTIIMRPL